MKLIKLFVIALTLVMFGACTGGYNASTCDSLMEKVRNHQDLSDSDCSEMIDQVNYILKDLSKKEEASKDDLEAKKAFQKDPEVQKMAGYAIGFAMYLEFNKKKLSESNQKKLEETEKELENIKL